jgi:hypothetical protein
MVYDLRTDIEDIHQLYVLEALVFHFWKQLLRITSSSNDSEQKVMFSSSFIQGADLCQHLGLEATSFASRLESAAGE